LQNFKSILNTGVNLGSRTSFFSIFSTLYVTKFSSKQQILIFDTIAVRTSKIEKRVAEYVAQSVA